MKKLRLIVLVILIASMLTGCTANNISPAFLLSMGREFTKIDMSSFGRVDVFSFDCNKRYIAFLYNDMPEYAEEYYGSEYGEEVYEEDGGMVGSEGEEYNDYTEEEDGYYNEQYDTYLGVYDIMLNRLVGTAVVDTLAYELAFADNGNIQLWLNDEGEITSQLYDVKLNPVGNGSGDPPERYDNESCADINTSRFFSLDSVLYDTDSAGCFMMIFPDSSTDYYLKKTDEISPIMAAHNKLVLEKCYSNPDSEDEIILSVNDYENGKCINTTVVDNSQFEFCRISRALVDDNFVLFDMLGSDFSTKSICCWNYRLNATSSELDYKIITEDSYDEVVNEITKGIKDSYNIELVMTPECESDENGVDGFLDYTWSNNLTCPEYLLSLYDLEYYLGTLPKELYTEMLCKDIDDPVASFEKQYIYLVGSIDNDDVGAYAMNKNGDLYIVYSCRYLSYSTFCHELMHNMEYRIWNYYEDFDSDWLALNPRHFEYDYDDYSDKYYSNEKYENYFMRDYSTRGLLEDRATTFEEICDASFYNREKWWQEKKHLNKKVTLLCKALSDSYPCADGITALQYCEQ